MDKNIDYKKDLAEKLEDLKKIEGFPIGTDEDILALSEPPYYTACPNPYIKDFIKEHGTPYDEEMDDYHREPFNFDIKEGKGDMIYNLHTYHTKVPPKAILKKILHYTKPGDIILDGFSGSGMTGVATKLTEIPSIVSEINRELNEEYVSGERKCILSDLSTFASFMGYNYSNYINSQQFKNEAARILLEVDEECGWMYKTKHTDNSICEVNYIVWSDIFECPYCKSELSFWDIGVDKSAQRNKDKVICSNCQADITSLNLKRIKKSTKDGDKTLEIAKQKPVMVFYKCGDKKYSKEVDSYDLAIIKKVEQIKIPYWYPTNYLPEGYNTKQPMNSHGLTRVDLFYTKRNLYATSAIFDRIQKSQNDVKKILLFWLQSVMLGQTKMNRYFEASYSQVNRYLKGTLYVGKKVSEVNFLYSLKGKMSKIYKYLRVSETNNIISSTNSSTELPLNDNSIDYIFIDPPFGANIMYSELNFIWEAWLKVFTNIETEAIINDYQNKKDKEYKLLLEKSLSEFYRVLKPKRWITVEFHNSKSDIWNIIQSAMIKAGFVIAKVSVLDKMQETFKQMTASGSVKSDLIITAFKPSNNFNERFIKQAGDGLEISFINEFLNNLPKQPAIERTDKMLYSKMLAYYIQRGYEIKYDAKSFYSLLNENFAQEDGFWFTTHQIDAYLEYKKKMKLEGMDDIKSGSALLFVNDEKSALVWLYNFLSESKTFSDISTAFNQLANIDGDEVPELKEMLEQNFISENGKFRRPQSETEHNNITEKRQKNLRREFETLLIQAQTEKKKIKLVRKEALVYGFELCYKEKRFADILTIAKKLDKKILENSGELNDFVEAAEIMIEGIQ